MNWTVKNESPVGYEPVYTVFDKITGRDIATGLEEDEALKIANCEQCFFALKDLVEIVDEIYVKTTINDKDQLDYISATLIEAQKLLAKVKM